MNHSLERKIGMGLVFLNLLHYKIAKGRFCECPDFYSDIDLFSSPIPSSLSQFNEIARYLFFFPFQSGNFK